MNQQLFTIDRRTLAWFMLALFMLLVFRNMGVYPTVMKDEYVYSLASRLYSFSESTRSIYLYLGVFRLTNYCGDGYFECAKVLNASFFVLGAPFIYLIARQVATERVAVIVTVLSLLGPINSYTAYFMPEAMVFFCFWVFSWVTLRLRGHADTKSWIVAGLIFGLFTMSKGRVLAILPALLLYLVFISAPGNDGLSVSKSLKVIILFLLSAFLIRIAVGYLFTHVVSASPVDGNVEGIAGRFVSTLDVLGMDFLRLSLLNFLKQLLALCLLLSVPIAILNVNIINSLFRSKQSTETHRLCFFTLTVILSMLVAVSFYVVSEAYSATLSTNYMASHPGETPASVIAFEAGRVQFRYYNFMLPLLFIVAASQINAAPSNTQRLTRLVSALPVGIALVVNLMTGVGSKSPYFVDGPELWGIANHSMLRYGFGIASLGTLIAWIFTERQGSRLFMFLFIPVAIAVSSAAVHDKVRASITPNAYDQAGLFAKQVIPRSDNSLLLVIGPSDAGLYRTLFQADHRNSFVRVMADEQAIDLAQFRRKPEWILAFGNHLMSGGTYVSWLMGGYTLSRLVDKISLDFTLGRGLWPGLITSKAGLSMPESWGTWSDANTVTLRFVTPLPKHFRLRLKAAAFGPNVGAEFRAICGSETHSFTLDVEPRDTEMHFTNDSLSDTLRIAIPKPTSPQELGQSDDARKLGISLFELHIDPI